jgi:hypothetical protein
MKDIFREVTGKREEAMNSGHIEEEAKETDSVQMWQNTAIGFV